MLVVQKARKPGTVGFDRILQLKSTECRTIGCRILSNPTVTVLDLAFCTTNPTSNKLLFSVEKFINIL